MRAAVVREVREHERRVALVPELVSRLTGAGLDVVIEPNAGSWAFHHDDEYVAAGAQIAQTDVLESADVILSVQPLEPDRIARLKPGAVTISFLPVSSELEVVKAARDAGVTALGVESSAVVTDCILSANGRVYRAELHSKRRG
jgi:H+-translocating NAD(P) transhydrogenase subunit alpha